MEKKFWQPICKGRGRDLNSRHADAVVKKEHQSAQSLRLAAGTAAAVTSPIFQVILYLSGIDYDFQPPRWPFSQNDAASSPFLNLDIFSSFLIIEMHESLDSGPSAAAAAVKKGNKERVAERRAAP